MFEIKKLNQWYGSKQILFDLDICINKGEIVGFIGKNGAGKTTTFKSISGLLDVAKGTIQLNGEPVNFACEEDRKSIAYLSDENPLIEDMYIPEFLNYISQLIYGYENSEQIENLIKVLDLQLNRNKKIKDLSKGYRQRVGLAHVLLQDAKVLVLDEPFATLDPSQKEELFNYIQQIKFDKHILFSSHQLEEVESLCDRYYMIDSGKISMSGNIRTKNNISTFYITLNDEIETWRIEDLNVTKISSCNYLIEGEFENIQEKIFDSVILHRRKLYKMVECNQNLKQQFNLGN